jgi:hypothetical protein
VPSRENIEEHVVLAFLERVLEDRWRGRLQPVDAYCRLFPGADARLRAEYAALSDTPDVPGSATKARD